nr:tyrosine-type recombinase/integrase [Sphingomonas alba]
MNARLTKQEGRPIKARCGSALNRHVVSNADLAAKELHTLTAAQLRKWRAGLAVAPATRQRVTNDLKAALNESAPTAALKLIIKEGLASPKGESHAPAEEAADASKLLTDQETRKLLKAIHASDVDGDLYRMALLMAATGARFAQLRRLTVGDVQGARLRVMVPASRKGRVGSAQRASVPVPVGQDVIDALLPVTKGRKASEPLLERWRHKQTGPATWERDSRGAWQSAAELARPIRAAVKSAELGDSVSAYSFRHSSIVRALREGLPVRLVAQLHDTSIAMIERNYTRFMAHALEDVARKAIVPMVEEDRGENVVSITAAKAT